MTLGPEARRTGDRRPSMKMHRIRYGIAVVLMMLASPAHAGRNITLPFEEKFDSGDTWTADLRWVVNGATGTHLVTGGWKGGCARFTPPTSAPGSNGTYSGLGSFTGLNHKTIHIRYLMKIGATYHLTHQGMPQNKHVILNKHVGSDRGMTMLQKYVDAPPHYHTFGAYSNNGGASYYQGGGITPPPFWPNGQDAFKNTDHLAEWFCIEHAFDLNAGTARIYLWTQDGSLSGQYIEAPKDTSSTYSEVQIIGGYYNSYHTADPDTYLLFDELKIATSFIGPPPGFLTTPPPDAGVPDAAKPDASIKPDAKKLDAVKLDAKKPDAVKPDAVKLDAVKPDAVKLDAKKLDLAGLDAVTGDASRDGPRPEAGPDAPRRDLSRRDASSEGQQSLGGGCGCTLSGEPGALGGMPLLLLLFMAGRRPRRCLTRCEERRNVSP